MAPNRLREELRKLIAAADTTRPPALRRSRREEWLYATDLPRTADRDQTESFRKQAEEAGWRTEEKDGWIELDLPGALPQDTGFRGPWGEEARACASLLRRHPAGRVPGDRERRMLTKAAEEGTETFEKTCRLLHREWAAMLRERKGLPELPEKIFREEGQE